MNNDISIPQHAWAAGSAVSRQWTIPRVRAVARVAVATELRRWATEFAVNPGDHISRLLDRANQLDPPLHAQRETRGPR